MVLTGSSWKIDVIVMVTSSLGSGSTTPTTSTGTIR